MKKIIILCIASMLCCSCFHYVEQEQYGIVVNVEYHEPYTSIQIVPMRVGKITITQPRIFHRSEYWHAHVHYNDTICVYQNFIHEVHPGDTVSRTILIRK